MRILCIPLFTNTLHKNFKAVLLQAIVFIVLLFVGTQKCLKDTPKHYVNININPLISCGEFENSHVGAKGLPAELENFHGTATNSDDTWLSLCKHHLCTPHQMPAPYYLCDPSQRVWGLTFLSGSHVPSNAGEYQRISSEIKGHYGWASSVVRGFEALGNGAGRWNFNPSHDFMIHEVVWTDNCREMLNMLNSGKFRQVHFIICGAVGVSFQLAEFDYQDSRIGFIIAPSRWVADEFRNSKLRLRVLVSGVDPEYWMPRKPYNERSGHVAIYVKNENLLANNTETVAQVKNNLENRRWNYTVVEYGKYDAESWKAALNDSMASIFIGHTESQCIAQAESWAMNVPTFAYVCSTGKPLLTYDRKWWYASEGPYLNYLNGANWCRPNELMEMLEEIHDRHNMMPRKYVLNTMSDKIALWNVFRAIQCEWERRYSE